MSARILVSPSYYPAADTIISGTGTQVHRSYLRTTTDDPIAVDERAEYFLYGPKHDTTHAALITARLDSMPERVWYTEAIIAAAYAACRSTLTGPAVAAAVADWACETPVNKRSRHRCEPYQDDRAAAARALRSMYVTSYVSAAQIPMIVRTALNLPIQQGVQR